VQRNITNQLIRPQLAALLATAYWGVRFTMCHILKLAIITFFLAGCTSLGGFVESRAPDEKFIDITGGIDRSFSYKFKVEYRTTTELNQCTTYHLALGKRIAQQFEFDYYPDIKGSTYSVRLPLQELEPNTPCNWKPVMAFLCVNSAGKEPTSCSSIFSFRGLQDIGSVTTIECSKSNFCFDSKSNVGSGAIDEFNRKYQVDIVAK
jgi:hypothetical protein